jgi:site-specific DNA-adenine methylase
MAEWGIPYMGSKDGIVESIALNFPKADHFYDLFGGGFSVSHFMVVNKSKSYKHFHYNEIKKPLVELVKRAINGEFNYNKFKPPFVTREMFFNRDKDDLYTEILWSFGNSCTSYLFGKDIEPYKKSMHNAVVFDKFDELAEKTFKFKVWPIKYKSIYQKRLYLRNLIEHYRKTKIPEHLHKFLNEEQRNKLKSIDNLRKLQQLQQLERLQQLNFTSLSYDQVEILPNSVVYCDPPYEGTAKYNDSFDHKKFLDWAATRNFPVFISEYNISDPRFKLKYSIDKRSMLSSDKTHVVKSEKLYWNGK